MHSEICPVCSGRGELPDNETFTNKKKCHGCKGNGYIIVPDADELKAMMDNPEMAKLMGIGGDKFEHKGGKKDGRKKY